MFGKKGLVLLGLALLLSFSAQTFLSATANPIAPPMLTVDSPQDNQIYPSSVMLSFAPTSHSGYNFTSFSYSLDGQPPKPTDGHTLLSDLACGSHTIEIYGNGTSDWSSEPKVNMLLGIVYFSVGYSTQWLVFLLVLVVVFVPLLLGCFINRRQLSARFHRKKTSAFWLGSAVLFFSAVIFAPSAWQLASNYLFPHYPRGLQFSAVPGFLFGLALVAAGLVLVAAGTRRQSFR
ncbi:MAG: hypothetical protein NWE93_07105 [Candidatus Bathyarchaeota archaeon]|nr:hypothetical protein [Candidatus Bathyarchaeota archaeon]